MLIGEEAAWLHLKEALPRLERMKAESSILQPVDIICYPSHTVG